MRHSLTLDQFIKKKLVVDDTFSLKVVLHVLSSKTYIVKVGLASDSNNEVLTSGVTLDSLTVNTLFGDLSERGLCNSLEI